MIRKAFQPICGTLKPFDESKRPTTPGIRPRPFTTTHKTKLDLFFIFFQGQHRLSFKEEKEMICKCIMSKSDLVLGIDSSDNN